MSPARLVRGLLLGSSISLTVVTSVASQTSYNPSSPDNMLTPANPIGTPPQASSAGTNETINLSSGSVSVFIPALSLPQRGGWNLTLGYVHNSMTWAPQQNVTTGPGCMNEGKLICGSSYTYVETMAQQIGPLDYNLPYLKATVEYEGDLTAYDSGGNQFGETSVFCVTNWVFTDWSGNKHTFGAVRVECNANTYPGAQRVTLPTNGYTLQSGDSTDGSWLHLDTSNFSDIRVTTKGGAVYHFPAYTLQWPSKPNLDVRQNDEGVGVYDAVFSSLVDTNGNTVTYNTSTGVLTDTIGRRITVGNGANGSELSFSYNDSNGNPQTISFSSPSYGTSQQYTFPFLSSPHSCYYQGPGHQPFPNPTATVSNTTLNLAPFTMTLSFPKADSTGTPRTYQMQFDQLSRLIQINYPSGGYTKYIYQDYSASQVMGQIFCSIDLQEVQQKRECTLSSGNCSSGQELVTNYSPSINGGNSSPFNGSLDETDPLGTRTHHVFDNTAIYPQIAPRETETDIYAPGGSLLRTTLTTWIGACSPDFDTALAGTVTTYLEDASPVLSSQEVRQYEQYSTCGTSGSIYYDNPTEIDEYDYASSGTGPVLKKTTQAWEPASAFTLPHILDRLQSRTTTDPVSNVQSTLTYGYDSAGLGNIISKSVGGTGLTTLTSNFLRDTYGNITQATDPKGNITKFGYTDTWAQTSCAPSSNSSAYLTSITDALNQVWNFSYDSCTGVKATATDPNGAKTSFSYDALSRTTQTIRPDTGQTTVSFVDAIPNSVTTTSSVASGVTPLTSSTILDGYGRTSQTQLTSDPDGTTYVDTTYDPLGRTYCVSNPYRTSNPNSLGNFGSTDGVTTHVYDALNRVTTLQPPDYWTSRSPGGPTCQTVSQATPANPTNLVSTSYLGNTTTVTDQAGKSRESVADALGRLKQVFEDPVGLNYETDYAYDAFGNLLCVGQKGSNTGTFSGCSSIPASWRPRTFVYDSLSRLTSATNPESGTITYSYDANSNVASKTSPAPNQTGTTTVTATYAYDPLNRLTQKSFSDGTTPTIKYGYDAVAPSGCSVAPPSLTDSNPIGRRTAMCDGAGAESWSHDPMGRILGDSRTTSGLTKTVPYTYNLDGSIASIIYRQDHYPETFTYTQGGAGRPISAGSSAGLGLAYYVHYAPNGSLCSMYSSWGQVFEHNYTFDNRLQVTGIQDWDETWYASDHGGSAPPPCTVIADGPEVQLHLTYSYTDANGHNNGNVINIGNNLDVHRTQLFTYDSLNRLATANTLTTNQPMWQGDTGALPNCWGEQFSYDPWGNLYGISPVSSAYTGCTQESLSMSPTTKNQLQDTNNDYVYDAAGNMTQPGPTGGPYVYDAENHLISAGGMAYLYDGDGKRVAKAPANTPTQPNYFYWYGTGSQILEETDNTGAYLYTDAYFNGQLLARGESDNWTDHFFTDALGNSRCVYGDNDPDGGCSDYYPFGAERPITNGGVNVSFKFTGKERDNETGLDNFGARYYYSSLGRFAVPDWATTATDVPYADFGNPQSLNLYTYVKNDPITFEDPDGHCDPGPGCVLQTMEFLDRLGNNFGEFAKSFLWGAVKQVLSDERQQLNLSPAPELKPANDVERAGAATASAAEQTNAVVLPIVVGAEGEDPGGTFMGPKEGSSGGEGAGQPFSPATKQSAVDENATANGGAARCVYCGDKVSNESGPNKVNIDHKVAKSKDGNNSLDNAQVTCQYCNQSKGAGPAPKNPKPKPDQNQ